MTQAKFNPLSSKMFVYVISSSFIVLLVAVCCQTRRTRVEPSDQQLILDAHNTARRDVTPTASNMQLMTWDESLANIAQRWAENCHHDHEKPANRRWDVGRFSVGQNIASNYPSWTDAIEGWAKEKKDFTYGNNQNKSVGHYTKMVWADTSKVGCGSAVCNVNCEGAIDGRHCNLMICEEDPYVPYVCPNTCKWCPHADAQFLK
ncbi:cysteine-rich venom protein VAR7-like [Dreissena polymorpha]|uniref:cysteine-rich venom protein VAR7-like n=1 Tax=Dreissena polymorpha TaxID=45954 RepID=UPI002263AD1C|nr:cysteine-rich venom protein VAR7-like [Dreissena polymorpha]